ncbi:hypothetical protein VOLCADRAFT_106118 [Volvox carteri f. nagariensis]|uniref:SAC3/GANP/THP3 conserved domain-containing protein n=1 Tax=Volvox carteri f. nagariensis TaxID=3068 RepID=D8U575_VOLCA|nr:uncharacterized protein VOLCADRAFT_106118 [Volvox carteri f. nagariensis]EFJ45164.1 hypothetical protein VOLCADRAFT_106118 [Volvox carteri f. nagariensis]|eukprot:XP_002953840.1 hypothetical protein VOLCADRAFT_106118 [Volvox carteri f. nagariensis]
MPKTSIEGIPKRKEKTYNKLVILNESSDPARVNTEGRDGGRGASPASAGSRGQRGVTKPVTTEDGGATDPAALAVKNEAAKRARADELMARLSKKLRVTTGDKKRLKLQAKMLRVLPKCSLPQIEPKLSASPPARGLATGTAAPGRSMDSSRPAAGCKFELSRTPKAALLAVTRGSSTEEVARLRLRQQRFGDATAAAAQEASGKGDVVLAESGGYGTSEALEKEYLRLTSLPRVADVRPPAVLAVALKLVKAKWLQRPDYGAASEQLKAIRQDLTVQHVRDPLTVDVYETHGRLALEADDLAEFRRCHGVLRQLYGEGLPGNPAEFEAYGLLYTQATAAARNTLSMELSRVPTHLLKHSFMRHALEVCSAARCGNYARFIALYDGAPRMSPYIMDRLLGQMRALALQSTVAAFKPLPVPLSHLAAQLGLETEEEAADLAEQYGAVADRQTGCLDTKASAAQQLLASRGSAAQ